jgi:hypothetical protein
MADLSLTAANIVPSVNALKGNGIAGETITAGQTVYKKASDGLYYKADGNDTTKVPVAGIAVCGVANGQPFFFIYEDPALAVGTHGAGTGTPLFQSTTPGGICAAADLATGNRTTLLGITTSATTVAVKIVDGGVAIP